MKLDLDHYRPNVGIALFNAEGKVWVGHRCGEVKTALGDFLWQMPQGGIDPGETPEEAAFRELEEETGSRCAYIIGYTDDWLVYDFPESVLKEHRGRWRGQKQLWFAMRFEGEDQDIHLEMETPEFDDWRWMTLADVPDLIVPFKRHVYQQVVRAFAHFAQPQNANRV